MKIAEFLYYAEKRTRHAREDFGPSKENTEMGHMIALAEFAEKYHAHLELVYKKGELEKAIDVDNQYEKLVKKIEGKL